MATIRAIYENGVFRPLRPIKLPEGAPVELIIVQEPVADDRISNGASENTSTPGPLVGEELAALLDQVASLPYAPPSDGRTDVSVHHDDFLYPERGK